MPSVIPRNATVARIGKYVMAEYKSLSDNSEIFLYYESFDEANRLTRGSAKLEFARMKELIQRFLRKPPAVILDVGGGPGKYSCWLAENGYKVHLIDPVEKHVMQAREASESQPCHPLASTVAGDARSLKHGSDSVDAVLLMGPLYHLTARDQRVEALREAHRVLKSGGLLIAKAINRFASLLDGLSKGFIDDPRFVSVLRRDIQDGQHRGYPENIGYFTTAYFHLPDELEAEVLEAGFSQRKLYSVKGPGELAANLEGRMSDPTKRKQLLDLIRSVEEERTLLGVSSHFIAVARK